MATPFQHYTIHYMTGDSLEAQVQLFSNGIFIGNLNFHAPGTTLPANTQTAGIFSLNYRIDRFSDVLQILQYEKPLQVHLRAGSVGDLMATGFEPVGEQEGH
jgi:hypothetical protein